MKKFFPLVAIALAMFSVSCTSTRQYRAPSVEPVRAGITASQGKVASAQGKVAKAQGHVTKAQTSAAALKKTTAELKSALDKDTLDAPILRLLVAEQNRQIDGLATELLGTQAALIETQQELSSAQSALADSQKQASTLQGNIQSQTDLLNKNTAALASAVHKYHRIKLYVCILGAAAALLLLLQFRAILVFIPPPYNLLAYVVGPGLVFGALWMFL